MPLNIIVAHDLGSAIGKDNKLCWRQKADMDRFKTVTYGDIVIMGANTARSLPLGYLSNRHNIIVSSTINRDSITISEKHSIATTVDIVSSIDDAITLAATIKGQMDFMQIWIIGGAQIYNYVLENRLHEIHSIVITEVHTKIEKPNVGINLPFDIVLFDAGFSKYMSPVYIANAINEFPYRYIRWEREL